MKVIAFNGSPHVDGNTSLLLGKVLEPLQAEGIETEIYQLGGQEIRGCRGCYVCARHQDGKCHFAGDIVNACVVKMVEADGIIIGSPTYFADVTSETKALIDRVGFVCRVNGELLRRKVGAAVIAAGRSGGVQAYDTINHFFLASQMIVPGSSNWNVGIGDVLKEEEGMRAMRVLGENMAWVLKGLKGEK